MASCRWKGNYHLLGSPMTFALNIPSTILSSTATYGGPFVRLPKELVFEIFDLLPLADVGNLALASECLRILVAEWIPTARCLKRSLIPLSAEIPTQAPNIEAPATKQGLLQLLRGPPKLNPFAILCKRMTCLLNTKERIKYAFRIFEQSLAREYRKSANGSSFTVILSPKQDCNDWKATITVIQFITMLHTFIRGWDESEFRLILHELDAKFALKQKFQQFYLSTMKGSPCLSSEMELRLFTRCLSWDFAGNDYGHRAVLSTLFFTHRAEIV